MTAAMPSVAIAVLEVDLNRMVADAEEMLFGQIDAWAWRNGVHDLADAVEMLASLGRPELAGRFAEWIDTPPVDEPLAEEVAS